MPTLLSPFDRIRLAVPVVDLSVPQAILVRGLVQGCNATSSVPPRNW